MSLQSIAPAGRKRGPRKINFEAFVARFPEGTLPRIDAVVEPSETISAFIRSAVEAELRRREKAVPERRTIGMGV